MNEAAKPKIQKDNETNIPVSPMLHPLPSVRELGRPGVCVLTADGLILTEGEANSQEFEDYMAERISADSEVEQRRAA